VEVSTGEKDRTKMVFFSVPGAKVLIPDSRFQIPDSKFNPISKIQNPKENAVIGSVTSKLEERRWKEARGQRPTWQSRLVEDHCLDEEYLLGNNQKRPF